jgi:hypothetical protein
VAPDHPNIKSVSRVYEKTAALEGFRFFGNVELGRDIFRADLLERYHVVIYAFGAEADRKMGIPGEDLPGSWAATEFVAWYNGHPDYRELEFDLSSRRAVVIGNGNVAVDVARMLALSADELAQTDIADHALDALRESQIELSPHLSCSSSASSPTPTSSSTGISSSSTSTASGGSRRRTRRGGRTWRSSAGIPNASTAVSAGGSCCGSCPRRSG